MNNSIHNIVATINSSLSGLITGGKWHGVASTVRRNNVSQPEANGKYIGIDDVHPLIAYHKLISLTSAVTRGSGYGDSLGAIKNTYTNALIVFVNRDKCGFHADEVMLAIQANIPDMLNVAPYKSVQTNITRIDLDSETVYGDEYTNSSYRLRPEQYLFRINYTIETTFKKGCFDKCLQKTK